MVTGVDVVSQTGPSEFVTPAGASPSVPAVPANRTAPYSSATPEWLTPAVIVAIARDVLGGVIDLDPCANLEAPGWTGARVAYTVDDDGLASPWHGAVYCNPPYGQVIRQWAGKMRAEIEAHRARLVLALVPARVDTRWWRELTTPGVGYHVAVVFVPGRLRFVTPAHARIASGLSVEPNADARQNSGTVAPFPSALVLLGWSRPMFDSAVARLDPSAGAGGALWLPHAVGVA